MSGRGEVSSSILGKEGPSKTHLLAPEFAALSQPIQGLKDSINEEWKNGAGGGRKE